MENSSVVTKDTSSSLYRNEPQVEQLTFEQQFANIYARMTEAVDVTVANSLLDRFLGLDSVGVDLQARIERILDGTTQFVEINLPDSFMLPEWRINFGGEYAHDHRGGPYGAKISHRNISGITEDDHHPRVHALVGPDHIGVITENMIQWSGMAGHKHDGIIATAVDHRDLTHKSPDDHHHTLHDIRSHFGTYPSELVTYQGNTVYDTLSFIRTAVFFHANSDVFHAHGLTVQALLDLGLASLFDLQKHEADYVGHGLSADNAAQIELTNSNVATLSERVFSIGADIVALIEGVDQIDAVLPQKMFSSEFIARLERYGGTGTILGGQRPIEDGVFDNITVDTAVIATLSGLLSLTVGDLVVTGAITLNDDTLEQTWVKAGSSPTADTWAPAPAGIGEELNNIRYAITQVAGEPFDYLPGPPVLGETSSFAGDTLKTFEEVEWYRNWFMSHDYCFAMIVDTFADDTFMASGSATIEKHYLLGAGDYLCEPQGYGAEIQPLSFFVVHVETDDPFSVSVDVTVNGGADWTTVGMADFDSAITPVPAKQGKDAQVRITITGAHKVYSYGVLFGWRF